MRLLTTAPPSDGAGVTPVAATLERVLDGAGAVEVEAPEAGAPAAADDDDGAVVYSLELDGAEHLGVYVVNHMLVMD